MKEFLALIRKADFTDLFKYGSLVVNDMMMAELECSVDELSADAKASASIMGALFDNSNSFESSFTYLIIHYAVPEGCRPNLVHIEDVLHVYALDANAKAELEGSFDFRIQISDPLWPDALRHKQIRDLANDSLLGARNVINAIGCSSMLNSVADLVGYDVIDDVSRHAYDNTMLSGEHDFFSYLLRYKRHAFYSAGVVGYYMDAVHLFLNYCSHRELMPEEVEAANTRVMDFLQNVSPSKKFQEVFNSLCDNDQTKSFVVKYNAIKPSCNLLYVSVICLYFVDIFKHDGFSMTQTVDAALKTFGNDAVLALYLVGLLLGHSKTYDYLYESLPLPCFKSADQIQKARLDFEQHKRLVELQQQADIDNATDPALFPLPKQKNKSSKPSTKTQKKNTSRRHP